MNKTEVYSWRLDPELKQRLESAARNEKTSVARLLDYIVREWLAKREVEDEAEQRRIRAEAAKWIGSISRGQGPHTRERIRGSVRARLMEKRIRQHRDASGSRRSR
jgi:predicted DNA-binding protein